MKNIFPKILLFTVFILLLLGVIMVYSSSAIVATSVNHDAAYYLKRHSIYVLLGLLTLLFALKIDTNLYRQYAKPIYFIFMGALVLVLVPGLGKSAGGAARWIGISIFRFQPSEIFKFALIVYLSALLAKEQSQMKLFSLATLPHLLALGTAMILLLFQPDFGTTFLVAALILTMVFLSGARVTYLLIGITVAIPIILQLISKSPYRLGRILAFLEPWSHRQNKGYQIVESLISFGSGRFWGLGLGNGPGKLHFLPAAHTDFILAMVGEELGFLGVSLIIICFSLIAICGFKIALAQTDRYKNFLAAGLTTALILQAILNIFVVMGLVPTKGFTLPFLSFGGSSLIMSCFTVGVLARIAYEPIVATNLAEGNS